MTDEEITYEDIKEYESLFTIAPSFILNTMAKRKTNLVLKFKSTIVKYLNNLTKQQSHKLNLVLSSDIVRLQKLMFLAYKKTGKKQFYILADPDNREFVEMNLDEIRKLVNND